jgi:hypothetical protein
MSGLFVGRFVTPSATEEAAEKVKHPAPTLFHVFPESRRPWIE